MIWSTWWQHRTTIVAAVGGILVLAVVALVCGFAIRGFENPAPFGVLRGCEPGDGRVECWSESTLTLITLVTTVLPLALGALVGVTVFSRDIERGTHVLGLSQSVGRLRWYWSRILVVFVPVTVAMGLLGFVLEWTRTAAVGPDYAFVSRSNWYGYSQLTFPLFQSSGLTAGAYTFLALVMGSLLALLLRNTLGAMTVTLIAMAAVLVGLQVEARPHYTTPTVETRALDWMDGAAAYIPDNMSYWLLRSGYADSEGNYVDIDLSSCYWVGENADWSPRPDETGAQFAARQEILQSDQNRDISACIQRQGADHFEVRYHPDSLFRRFQLIEVALVLALSALLLIPSLWALRRLRP